MKITLTKRLCLTAMLTLAAAVYTSSAFAETSKLVIESGDSAQSRQQAAMEKEQWNDTRQLSRQAQAFGQCNFHGEFLLWERVKTIKQG